MPNAKDEGQTIRLCRAGRLNRFAKSLLPRKYSPLSGSTAKKSFKLVDSRRCLSFPT
jgi:hypothetical protein